MNQNNAKPKGKKAKKAAQVKLKTILGDPFQKKCPVLEEDEVHKLTKILKNLVKDSGKTGREFATLVKINVGMESSLRAINQGKASCVLLSLSMKPHCMISLIARNSEVKDESVPVYAQPKLENIAEEIFGVRALALVFPKNLEVLGNDLKEWISSKQKIVKKDIKVVIETPKVRKSQKRKKSQINSQNKKPLINTQENTSKPSTKPNIAEAPSWSGDYISFGSTSEPVLMDTLQLNEEKNLLSSVLSKIQEKIPKTHTKQQPQNEEEKAYIFEEKIANLSVNAARKNDSSDSDDFLPDPDWDGNKKQKLDTIPISKKENSAVKNKKSSTSQLKESKESSDLQELLDLFDAIPSKANKEHPLVKQDEKKSKKKTKKKNLKKEDPARNLEQREEQCMQAKISLDHSLKKKNSKKFVKMKDLPEYQPLVLYRLQPNPNRKPKEKKQRKQQLQKRQKQQSK